MRLLLILRFSALACLLPIAPHVWGQDDCPKRVFGLYCLGADTKSLVLEPIEGQPGAFRDAQGNSNTVLEIDQGQLLAVERRVEPGGWREFDTWLKRLERIYRSGTDASTFPRYAASRSSRLNAIRSGRGSARTNWIQDGWLIALIWREPDAVHLRYELANNAAGALSVDDL